MNSVQAKFQNGKTPEKQRAEEPSLAQPKRKGWASQDIQDQRRGHPAATTGNPGSILTEYLQHSLGVSVQVTCFQCVELGRRTACKLVGPVRGLAAGGPAGSRE